MSEELKLLPCPICGKPAVATTDHMLMEMVYCCGIAAESVSAWNALPRALTWTMEPPKVAGHYWCRYKNKGEGVQIIAYAYNFKYRSREGKGYAAMWRFVRKESRTPQS